MATKTSKLPSSAGVPEIRPLTSSIDNPDGSPLALALASEVKPLASTWKAKKLPVLPVALVALVITGPVDGDGSIVIVNVSDPVLELPIALIAAGVEPVWAGVPEITPVVV